MHVKELMTGSVFFLKRNRTVSMAKDIMEWHHIRHIPIVDDNHRVCGILSHRDLLAAAISSFAGAKSGTQHMLDETLEVSRLMKAPVLTIDEDADIRQAAALFLEHKIGCLVVVDTDQKLKGILSETDFLKWIESKLT